MPKKQIAELTDFELNEQILSLSGKTLAVATYEASHLVTLVAFSYLLKTSPQVLMALNNPDANKLLGLVRARPIIDAAYVREVYGYPLDSLTNEKERLLAI